MKKPVFIKNAAILTASSLILRLLGVVFKIWVAARCGGECMGAYQLILSLYWLFCAFSQTGVSVAVTRLCADCMSLKKDFFPVLKKAFVITGVTAAVSAGVMYGFAGKLSLLAVNKNGFAACFRLLAFSVLPVGFSACFRGFFFAVRKPSVSAASQIFEQIVRICVCAALVSRFAAQGTAAACTALVAGDLISEIFCAAFLLVRFVIRVKKTERGDKSFACGYRAVLRISFPLTAGRYISTALRTAENLTVPRGLAKSGAGAAGGIELFGNIKALALPVLLFPSGMLGAVSSLLVPEISAAAAKGRRLVVRGITEDITKMTCIVSVIFACIFAFCGNQIGMLLYKSKSVGALLCVLSPLVPLMYTDIVCDGLLKGLDCQRFTFFTAVSDSALRLAAVAVFLPRYGMTAYVLIMYFSNVYTAALNIGMLIKKSRGSIDTVKAVFLPLCFALIITKTASAALGSVIADGTLYICAFTAVSVLLYFLCLTISKCITAFEIRSLIAG